MRRHHAHYDFIVINQLTFTSFRMRVYAHVYVFDIRRKTAKVLVHSLLYQIHFMSHAGDVMRTIQTFFNLSSEILSFRICPEITEGPYQEQSSP